MCERAGWYLRAACKCVKACGASAAGRPARGRPALGRVTAVTVADCSNGSKARDCRQYRPGTSSRPIAEIVIRRCMGCLEIARWREQLNSVRKYIECVRTHPSCAQLPTYCPGAAGWQLATCTLDLLDLPVAISFAQCVVLAPCDGARWNCGDVVTPRVLSGAADRLGYAGEKSLIAAIGRKLHIVEITTVDSASCDPLQSLHPCR